MTRCRRSAIWAVIRHFKVANDQGNQLCFFPPRSSSSLMFSVVLQFEPIPTFNVSFLTLAYSLEAHSLPNSSILYTNGHAMFFLRFSFSFFFFDPPFASKTIGSRVLDACDGSYQELRKQCNVIRIANTLFKRVIDKYYQAQEEKCFMLISHAIKHRVCGGALRHWMMLGATLKPQATSPTRTRSFNPHFDTRPWTTVGPCPINIPYHEVHSDLGPTMHSPEPRAKRKHRERRKSPSGNLVEGQKWQRMELFYEQSPSHGQENVMGRRRTEPCCVCAAVGGG